MRTTKVYWQIDCNILPNIRMHSNKDPPFWEGPAGCGVRNTSFQHLFSNQLFLGLLLFISIRLSWGLWWHVYFSWSAIVVIEPQEPVIRRPLLPDVESNHPLEIHAKINVKLADEMLSKSCLWTTAWTLTHRKILYPDPSQKRSWKKLPNMS